MERWNASGRSVAATRGVAEADQQTRLAAARHFVSAVGFVSMGGLGPLPHAVVLVEDLRLDRTG